MGLSHHGADEAAKQIIPAVEFKKALIHAAGGACSGGVALVPAMHGHQICAEGTIESAIPAHVINADALRSGAADKPPMQEIVGVAASSFKLAGTLPEIDGPVVIREESGGYNVAIGVTYTKCMDQSERFEVTDNGLRKSRRKRADRALTLQGSRKLIMNEKAGILAFHYFKPAALRLANTMAASWPARRSMAAVSGERGNWFVHV